MNIIKPSMEEKERAIEIILSEGLSKPKSLWRNLYEMYRALGFRYIFLDMAQPVTISAVLMYGFMLLWLSSQKQYTNAALFATAPVFFVFVLLFSEILEHMNDLYELKMTCKYTFRQITAFRVLCFSLAGTVLCTFASLVSQYMNLSYFLKAISISLCSLFLCSFLSMYIMRRFNWKWMYFTPVLLWILIGILPVSIFGSRWEFFLSSIPVAVTLFIAAIAFALFLMEIKKLVNMQRREVVYYAGS